MDPQCSTAEPSAVRATPTKETWMTAATEFSKLVPGFDFLQGLMKNAGAGLPSMGQWIAPTLDPEELDKRIQELRTVQFWLEQNARMLGVTIQALEVQRMTLSTLQTMNLPLAEIGESLRMKTPAAPPAPAPAPPVAAAPEPAPAPRAPRRKASADAAPAAGAGVVDPMLWWGALTKQFSELAANAVKDGTAEAAKNLAGAVVKQSVDVAGQTLKSVVQAPVKAAARAAAPRKRRT
jgi:hypothetical protein